MFTKIYSCGDSMNTVDLITMHSGTVVDVWFPELEMLESRPTGMPLREPDILAKIPELTGKSFVTVSEVLILGFLREIRLGRMQVDELELWCDYRQIDVSTQGGMIDYWDGGWEVGYNLRFH